MARPKKQHKAAELVLAVSNSNMPICQFRVWHLPLTGFGSDLGSRHLITGDMPSKNKNMRFYIARCYSFYDLFL